MTILTRLLDLLFPSRAIKRADRFARQWVRDEALREALRKEAAREFGPRRASVTAFVRKRDRVMAR